MNPLSVILASAIAAACVTPVEVKTLEEAREHPVRKLALAPFSVGIPLAETQPRVLEGLTLWTDFLVVPPEEVLRVLMAEGPMEGPRTPAEIGATLRASFGIDAVILGTVHRFVPRIGKEGGASRPAAVGFELELRTPEGALVWLGSYDEIQRGLSEDPGSLQRAVRRGFRWVSAEELVEYGAQQLVRRLPQPSWK
jgi:hypothetical protein